MTAINPQAVRGPVTAVPVVAGKGVRFVADTDNNRWVVEADETVLFDAGTSTTTSSCNLSESYKNFDKVKFYFRNSDAEVVCVETLPSSQGTVITVISGTISTEPKFYVKVSTYTLGDTTLAHRNSASYTVTSNAIQGWSTTGVSNYIVRIVGINRIASN